MWDESTTRIIIIVSVLFVTSYGKLREIEKENREIVAY